jgi:Uma2 family endonuclease
VAPDLFARSRRGLISVSDLPDDTEGARYELNDGSLYATPAVAAPHQMLCFDLGRALASRLPPGLRVALGVNVIVGEQALVIPDVAVIDPGQLTRHDVGVTPPGLLLALEVTSASTRHRDLSIKRELSGEWKVPYIVVDRNGGPYTVTACGPRCRNGACSTT